MGSAVDDYPLLLEGSINNCTQAHNRIYFDPSRNSVECQFEFVAKGVNLGSVLWVHMEARPWDRHSSR